MNNQLSAAADELIHELCALISGYQLPENRADRRFIRIPSAGQAQSGEASTEFGEERIRSKGILDQHGIQIQVEHSPHTADNLENQSGIFRENSQLQLRHIGNRFHPKISDRAAEAENAFEKSLGGDFDARNQMGLIKSEDALPVVRGPERELEIDSCVAVGF